MDYGPNPFVTNIDSDTLKNDYYRSAVWTAGNLQVMLMSLPVGLRADLELHDTDHYINVVEGQGVIESGPNKENLDFRVRVSDGYAFMIPANVWHRFYNIGSTPIKFYIIYGPPQWPHGTVVETLEDEENAI
ncbi:MAG: cupin domain-containing protein [Anaerotignaceae bacterium]